MPRPHESLAQRLQHARKKRGWSQDELAEKSGLKQPDISKLETGRMLKTTGMARLARVLRVPDQWLEFGEGSEPDWDAVDLSPDQRVADGPAAFGELTPREAVLVMLHRQLETRLGGDAVTLHELIEDLTKAPDDILQSALTQAAMTAAMAVHGPKRVRVDRVGSKPSRAPRESPSTEATEADESTSARNTP